MFFNRYLWICYSLLLYYCRTSVVFAASAVSIQLPFSVYDDDVDALPLVYSLFNARTLDWIMHSAFTSTSTDTCTDNRTIHIYIYTTMTIQPANVMCFVVCFSIVSSLFGRAYSKLCAIADGTRSTTKVHNVLHTNAHTCTLHTVTLYLTHNAYNRIALNWYVSVLDCCLFFLTLFVYTISFALSTRRILDHYTPHTHANALATAYVLV